MATDTCVACGRRIWTIPLQRPIVTRAQQWTHGKRRWDRSHAPIPARHDYKVIR